MSVSSTAPARALAPPHSGAPTGTELPAQAGTDWDPLQFRATAQRASGASTPVQRQTRLVWSNGRTRTLPEPGTWCATVARACAEALHGSRPATQLHRWLDVEVYTALQRRARLAARMRPHGVRAHAVRVRRVRRCRIRPGVWEAAVVLQDGRRVRAAAIRIEAHRGHWRATAIQMA